MRFRFRTIAEALKRFETFQYVFEKGFMFYFMLIEHDLFNFLPIYN